MPFQNVVNLTQAPAVEGDFASNNPRASVLAGPGGLITGPNGVTVGKFAWIGADLKTVTNSGTAPNAPDGFVHRDEQALITKFLGEASQLIPQGFPVTLMRSGDFWAKNLGPSALVKGNLVYAGYADGGIYSAAPTGVSATATLGSTSTGALGATFTASAGSDATQLVVTSVTGLISVGDMVSGVGITSGTTILSQVSGTAGGAGTYKLSATNTASAVTVTSFGSVFKTSATTGLISIGDTVSGGAGFPVGATVVAQTAGTAGGAGTYVLSAPGTAYTASATGVTTFGVVLNVTAVASGTLAPGMPVTGTNIPASDTILAQLTGAIGGIGTYLLATIGTQYVASEAVTTVGGIVTAWYAVQTTPGDGAVGALVKISPVIN